MRTSHLRLLIILPVLSLMCYLLDYFLFRDQQDIENWILNSLGFVFIDVLLVTIILQDILERREREARIGKLDNLIGLFFTEGGLDLLRQFLRMDISVTEVNGLVATDRWSVQDFNEAIDKVGAMDARIKATPGDLAKVKRGLIENRDFLVQLMESPVLFEHERFTDLMAWTSAEEKLDMPFPSAFMRRTSPFLNFPSTDTMPQGSSDLPAWMAFSAPSSISTLPRGQAKRIHRSRLV